MKVGIVGAGVAGLACAGRLAENGIAAELFDKGRRPGGRLSTLKVEQLAWDFGAQYFTVRDPGFAARVAQWAEAGVVASWASGPEGAHVGVPGMGSLVEAMQRGLAVRHGALVQSLEHRAGRWSVHGPGLAEGGFDALVVAVPAEQAAPLVSLHDLTMARAAAAVRSGPCWTLMAAFPERLAGVPDTLRGSGPIAWAARDNAKPGRADDECWVVQAGAEWTRRNLERDREAIAEDLLALFGAATGVSLPPASFARAHRWRYALPVGGPGQPLWNARLGLGACGDWCIEGRIESAWLSGVDLANRVAEALRPSEWQAAE